MVSRKRKLILEDSTSESESEFDDEMKGAGVPSTEGHYDTSEITPEVNLGSENDPLFQAQTDQSSVNKSTDSMLGLEEESVSDSAQQKMIVVRMETHSQYEPLDIVPIQVCMPSSQTIAASPIQIEPSRPKSLSKKISEETIKGTPQPQKRAESTPTVPPAPSKINPPLEATAVLMMIANTTSYVLKQFLAPSFSLGFTDSSQEETMTQEGRPGSE
ncbi:hypothetical protein AHAS_Ahas13G0341600 [Arachis hypogaea]